MSLKDTNATLFNMLTDLEEEKRSSSEEDEDIENSASLEETQMVDEKTSHFTAVNPLDNLFDTNATAILGNTKTVLADPADIKKSDKKNTLEEDSISKAHVVAPSNDSDNDLKEESLIQEDNLSEPIGNKDSFDFSNEETCMSENEESNVVSLHDKRQQKNATNVTKDSIENKNEVGDSISSNDNTASLTLSKFMEHVEDSVSQSQEPSEVLSIEEVPLDTPLDLPLEPSSSTSSEASLNSPPNSSLEVSSESPVNSLSESSPELSSGSPANSLPDSSPESPADSLPESLPESSLDLPLDSSSNLSLESSSKSSPDISIELSKLSFDSFDSPSSEEHSKISEASKVSSIVSSASSSKVSSVASSEPVKESVVSKEDDISASAGVILKRADQLKIAQERIHELENTVFAVRQENAGFSSEIETLKKRIEELSSLLDSTERRNRTKMESLSDERNLLEESLFQKNREYNNLKLKIEELKNRLAKDLKSVRVREIELENRLELVKQEKTTLLKSKDEVILNLKRKTEHLIMDIDGYRKKAQLSQVQISENEERIQRSVRALRLALGMLEGSDSQ